MAFLALGGLLAGACSTPTVETGTGTEAGAPRPTDLPTDGPDTTTCPPRSSTDNTPCPGVSFEELRDLNLHYADRQDFIGDPTEALRVAEDIRVALAELLAADPAPDLDDLRRALAPWATDDADLATSDNAVRTAGVAFALAVPGGCVFGSLAPAATEPEVSVGGYINDGGCLASYGH